MKIAANLIEVERLIRKCAEIQHGNTYSPCKDCVLESFCESSEEMHKLIEYSTEARSDE